MNYLVDLEMLTTRTHLAALLKDLHYLAGPVVIVAANALGAVASDGTDFAIGAAYSAVGESTHADSVAYTATSTVVDASNNQEEEEDLSRCCYYWCCYYCYSMSWWHRVINHRQFD